MSDQITAALITALQDVDEEGNDIAHVQVHQHQCTISKTKVMIMFDKCSS